MTQQAIQIRKNVIKDRVSILLKDLKHPIFRKWEKKWILVHESFILGGQLFIGKSYKGNSRKWLNNDQVKLEQIKWLQDASFWLEIDTLFSINHFKLQFARWIIQSQNNCWHKPFLDLSHLDIFCLLSVNNQARSKNDYPCHLCPTDSEFQRLHWTYFIT